MHYTYTIEPMRISALASLLLAIVAIQARAVYPAPAKQAQSSLSTIPMKGNESTFLILTDIHFDPFTGLDPDLVSQLAAAPVEKWQTILKSQPGQKLSPDGVDANYPLVASALEAARNSGAHYDYVVVTGDFLGHNFPEKYRHYYRPDGAGYQDFVLKTMAFVNRLIEQAFPSIPIYEALGNNDSIGGDYAAPGPRLLAAMAKEWKIVASHPSARKDFLLGGYYAVPHPTVPSLELIVLDTAYWSHKRKTADASGSVAINVDAGAAELSWFAAQLDRLRSGRKSAALLMHIPPSIDAYDSARPGHCASPTLFWSKQYLDSFLAILESHKDVVRDGYAGHTHIDDFQVFTDTRGMPYFQIHIAPSIGRDPPNTPGFDVGVYDKTSGALVDYAASYLKNSSAQNPMASAWTFAYDFRKESRFPTYSPASLQTIALLIRSSATIRAKIMGLYGTRTSSTPVPVDDWRFYSCAQTETDPGSFGRCACPGSPGND